MDVIIFLDKDNFDGSLRLINENTYKGKERFWDINKYASSIFNKLRSRKGLSDTDIKLIKIILYTGRYTSKLMNHFRWDSSRRMMLSDELIKNEENLFKDVSSNTIETTLKDKIKVHVSKIVKIFREEKQNIVENIKKHENHRQGQNRFFRSLQDMPLIDLRTTPLRYGNGEIIQKGVDVMLATDLVHLAHTSAYDIALILGGDRDLIESIKLIKDTLHKTVFIASYYTPKNSQLSNIGSDLVHEVGNNFINLRDFNEKDIDEMSVLRHTK